MKNYFQIIMGLAGCTVFFGLAFLLIYSIVGRFDDPEALRSAKEKFSFEEVATYKYSYTGSRAMKRWARHKVVLVKEELNFEELMTLTRLLSKAYPDTSIDFLDDESLIREYVEWNKRNIADSDSDLSLYVYKHRIARIMVLEDDDRRNKWFLTDGRGNKIARL